jgi:hypothetical protein
LYVICTSKKKALLPNEKAVKTKLSWFHVKHINILLYIGPAHHAEGLVNPKVRAKNFGY